MQNSYRSGHQAASIQRAPYKLHEATIPARGMHYGRYFNSPRHYSKYECQSEVYSCLFDIIAFYPSFIYKIGPSLPLTYEKFFSQEQKLFCTSSHRYRYFIFLEKFISHKEDIKPSKTAGMKEIVNEVHELITGMTYCTCRR